MSYMGVSESGIEPRISLLCGLQKDQTLSPLFEVLILFI